MTLQSSHIRCTVHTGLTNLHKIHCVYTLGMLFQLLNIKGSELSKAGLKSHDCIILLFMIKIHCA